MTGVREHFKELDEKVSGKVRFRDGSYIEIKGKGSILIECDDEKQRIISHIYYIPSLKSKLLSLGQFTKIGCKVVTKDDELRLYDMDNKIFMKVTRQRNRLYKANLRIAKARSASPLDLVYGDLCGPISPPTPSGKKYIFLLVDDYSRYMWVYFLSTKDQAFDTFKEYKKTIENELRTTLKMLRTDRGGEFTSNEFTQYCKENGIARQLTAPYSPQQNGVVERRNRTIMSTTRCMMKATNMPQNFWAEAVRHAIYILNSVPTKALEDITPYEAIKRRKPNLENLRVFGCIAYAKVPSQHLTKTLNDLYENIEELLLAEDEAKNYKEAGMIDCNETLIPMDPGTKLTKITEGTMVNSTEYRSLIGCLRYLLHTRPELSYSVGLLSRFMQELKEQHMKAIRQVLRYVKGTKDYGITYKHNEGNKIHGFSDSSYGVNTQEGKGTTGIIFYYGESPISWSTQKQATVSLSSCKSKFIAATAATTQALWLKRLLSKLTHSQEEKVTIMVDKKYAIALMKNPVFHGRSKHIDMKYHFIRECVKREDIQVEFVSGEYQKVDILIKALPKIKFLTMRQLIGLNSATSDETAGVEELVLTFETMALLHD
ncbi:ribonuclease H-like domain, reverse transcriptase, RNA-dependent DNA polymerase [Tanacetum coccineum]